jgi:hypothetical protein
LLLAAVHFLRPASAGVKAAGADIDGSAGENRIKSLPSRKREWQLELFADRTSAATMRANQLRLWFVSIACVLLCALRRIALQHTQFAKATCGTIRLKLLNIGALVRTSVRRIKFATDSGCPYQHEFVVAHARLTAAAH